MLAEEVKVKEVVADHKIEAVIRALAAEPGRISLGALVDAAAVSRPVA